MWFETEVFGIDRFVRLFVRLCLSFLVWSRVYSDTVHLRTFRGGFVCLALFGGLMTTVVTWIPLYSAYGLFGLWKPVRPFGVALFATFIFLLTVGCIVLALKFCVWLAWRVERLFLKPGDCKAP